MRDPTLLCILGALLALGIVQQITLQTTRTAIESRNASAHEPLILEGRMQTGPNHSTTWWYETVNGAPARHTVNTTCESGETPEVCRNRHIAEVAAMQKIFEPIAPPSGQGD